MRLLSLLPLFALCACATTPRAPAAAASLVGQCGEAVRAQRHALAMLGAAEGVERERSHLAERLAEYEQCAAQAQAKPAAP